MVDIERPKNIGIIDIQPYFPTFYVDQNELEEFDKVGKGKYTQGIGQESIAVFSDREDINSICLTVLDQLLTRNNLNRKNVGRLEVGTETILDKSKSVKTYLMSLFKDYNTDIEGVTTFNACYGGTNALFNTINWIESNSYDGRYAIVVMGDIAVYKKGPVRSSGGGGSVAILLGPNAPVVIEPVRASYMNHTYDFYKPNPSNVYPEVESSLSIDTYFKALEACYHAYMDKQKALESRGKNYITSLNSFDYFCFHSPFGKMVEKAFVNLVNFEIRRTNNYESDSDIKANKFYLFQENNKELINKILSAPDFRMDNSTHNELKKVINSRSILKDRVSPSLYISRKLGNTYTCALYMNICSLLMNKNIDLRNKRLFMFSYGSGCASSMFSFRVVGDISSIQERNKDVVEKFANRIKISPKEFEKILDKKEYLYTKNNHSPQTDISTLREDAYYLTRIDDKWRRYYSKKSTACSGMEMAFNKLSNNKESLSNNKFSERFGLLRNQLTGK